MTLNEENSLLRVVQLPGKGRAFLAAKDIPAGQLLFQTIPYAAVPDTHSRKRVCAGCLSDDGRPVRPCTGPCGRAYYCGNLCEKEDAEKGHALGECSFLADLFATHAKRPNATRDGNDVMAVNEEDDPVGYGPNTLDYMWLLLRVLTRRHLELSTNRKTGQPGNELTPTFEDVWALCSNRSSFPLKQRKEFRVVAQILAKYLSAKLGVNDIAAFLPTLNADDARPSDEATGDDLASANEEIAEDSLDPLIALICKEECNSFGLYSFRRLGPRHPRQGYALALYLEPVFFNHSCSPSVGHVVPLDVPPVVPWTPSAEMKIRTRDASPPRPSGKSDITKPMLFYTLEAVEKGQEVTINYIPLTGDPDRRRGRERRMKELEKIFFFRCDCPRCASQAKSKGVKEEEKEAERPHGMCGDPDCNGWYVPRHFLAEKTSPRPIQLGDFVPLDGWICEACGDAREEV